MFRRSTLGFVLLLIARGGPAPAADRPDPSADVVVLRHCPLEYSRTTLLASPLPGILSERLVKPGDVVKTGQVLGRLQDRELRAEMDLRKAESESETSIRVSEAKHARAIGKLRASEILHTRRFMSKEDFEVDRLDAETARMAVEDAKQQRRLARMQVRQVEAMIRNREFVSPHDGVIVEAPKNEGESVLLNESVFRVVDTRRVRATGGVDVADAWRIRAGQRVRVQLEVPGADLPVEREEFFGRVVFVDRRFQAGIQVCTVVAEVDNRDDLLCSGLECRLEIFPRIKADDGPSGEAPRPSTAPPVGPPAPSRTAALISGSPAGR